MLDNHEAFDVSRLPRFAARLRMRRAGLLAAIRCYSLRASQSGRATRDKAPAGQITSVLQKSCQAQNKGKSKIFRFPSWANHRLDLPSHPTRGALRTSRNARWDAVDAKAATDGRGGCGRQSRVVLAPRCWRQACGFIRRRRWQQAGHRGERVISRKPSRRESRGASAGPVCSCAHSSTLCTRDRGCSAHPAFPAPSSFGGARSTQASGAARRENTKLFPRRPGLEPGPITTGADGCASWSNRVFQNRRHGAWVPAFARTTILNPHAQRMTAL